MNEIEKLKLHLKQAMEIAEANIEKAENIDLVDMAQTLESFIDELNDIGDFEIYGELDEGFIRMNQLAGVITENQAKKMLTILNENLGTTDSVKLFDFPDDIKDAGSYKKIGFNVGVDDEVNGIYFAELTFKGYDWMSVLAILDDCRSFGLSPNLEYNGKTYSFDEAYDLVDSKAAGDEYSDDGVGKSSGRF